MLNSKQRAALRGIASNYETIFQIGKGGISETLISQDGRRTEKKRTYKASCTGQQYVSQPEKQQKKSHQKQVQMLFR